MATPNIIKIGAGVMGQGLSEAIATAGQVRVGLTPSGWRPAIRKNGPAVVTSVPVRTHQSEFAVPIGELPFHQRTHDIQTVQQPLQAGC